MAKKNSSSPSEKIKYAGGRARSARNKEIKRERRVKKLTKMIARLLARGAAGKSGGIIEGDKRHVAIKQHIEDVMSAPMRSKDGT